MQKTAQQYLGIASSQDIGCVFIAGGENRFTTSYGTLEKQSVLTRLLFLKLCTTIDVSCADFYCRNNQQEAGNYKYRARQNLSVLPSLQLQEDYLRETKNQRKPAGQETPY